jgi:hypothetical protein
MATDDSANQSRSSSSSRRRCRRRSDLGEEDEIEEGEFAGSDTDDDSRYVFQHPSDRVHNEGRPQIKRQRLEENLPPTPSCDYDSDGTISDIDAADGAAALAQEMSFPCPVCRRAFRSDKARCGHMHVHNPLGRQGNKEQPAVAPPISVGWAVTGKRGSVGSRSVSPESQGVVNSMAIVVVEPVIDPMSIAFASAQPHPPSDDSMAIVVASSDNPTSQVVVHQTSEPQVAFANPEPAVPRGQLAAAPPHILNSPAHQAQRAAPPPARDEQGWWICKEDGCNQRYATHQGLGGHMAGHKNRQNNEAAAAGVAGDASCAKPPKLHPCKHCPRVFTSGVQLGGHMRKHFPGKVIPKRRGAGARPSVSAGELASALTLSLPMPPAAMEEVPKVSASELSTALTLSLPMPPVAVEVTQAQPTVAPEPVVLRIFGFNIVPAPPAPAAEEVSSAVTGTDQSSAASTDNIQQQ